MENLNFIALDFETANSSRLSACSIGLVKVKNGKIIDEYYSLIKPSPFIFDFRNTQIHGITENDCVIAPSFLDIWPSISLWFQNQNIVGHWVSFERNVLGELSMK
jgi:DNA polymerase-3 subunit epsilon